MIQNVYHPTVVSTNTRVERQLPASLPPIVNPPLPPIRTGLIAAGTDAAAELSENQATAEPESPTSPTAEAPPTSPARPITTQHA